MIFFLLAVAPTLLGLRSTQPALAPAPSVRGQQAPPGKIPWSTKDLEAVLKDAKSEGKFVMLLLGAESSPASVQFVKECSEDDRVGEALKDLLCVRVDLDQQAAYAEKYGVKEIPEFVWFNPDGTIREHTRGYHGVDQFLGSVSRVKLDLGTMNELRAKVAAKPDDIDARFELYKRLKDVGDIAGSSEQKAAIIKLDPQGQSRASHHFAYERITSDIEQYWHQTGTLQMQKIGELKTFVEMETDTWIVWDGWMRLANTHAYLANQSATKGQFADAKEHRTTRRKYIALSARGVPQDPEICHYWNVTNGELFWNERDELSPEDKAFMLAMTTKFTDAFEKDALAWDLRGRAYFVNGQRPKAIDALEKAVELDPAREEFKNRLKLFRGG